MDFMLYNCKQTQSYSSLDYCIYMLDKYLKYNKTIRDAWKFIMTLPQVLKRKIELHALDK